MSSEAYSELFMSLVTDADAAAQFVNGIVPKGVEEDAAKIQAANAATAAATPTETPALAKASTALGTDEDPTGLTNHVTPKVLTEADLRDMDPFELRDGLRDGRYKLS